MAQLSTLGHFERMKNWKPVLFTSVWVILSLIAWLAAAVDVKGMYPDWDEHAGEVFRRFIYGALIFAWSIWIVWLLFGQRRQLYSWFRVGVCLALFLGVVRDFFMAEVVRLLHL